MLSNRMKRCSISLALLFAGALAGTAVAARAQGGPTLLPQAPKEIKQPLPQHAAATAPTSVPGELVVRLAKGVDVHALAARMGLTVKQSLRFAPQTFVFSGASGQMNAAARSLNGIPGVLVAQPNNYYQLSAVPSITPNDPLESSQWALRVLNAPETWGITVGERFLDGPRKEVTVGLIDAGPQLDHPDLAEVLDSTGFDAARNAPYVDDTVSLIEGHGTAMASCIAGVTNNSEGMSSLPWEAVTILPCNVATIVIATDGTISTAITTASLVNAINFCVDRDVDVINMSLGQPHFTGGDPLIAQAVTDAYNAGIIMCASSGNGRVFGFTGGVDFPAAYPEVIAIGAVGPSGELAFYSDGGPELELMAPGGNDQTFSSVGRMILVADSVGFGFPDLPAGYTAEQGTSPASAYASGSIATLLTQGALDETLPPTDQIEDIRLLLRSTARSPSGGRNNDFGFGLIDVGAALKRVTHYIDISNPTPNLVTESFGEPLEANIVQPVPSSLEEGEFEVFQNGEDVTDATEIIDAGSGAIRFQPDVNHLSRVGQNTLNVVAESAVLPDVFRSLEGPAEGHIPARSYRYRVIPHIEERGLGMFSIPYDLQENADTLSFLFGGNIVRLARWLPEQNRYAIFNLNGLPQEPEASLTTTSAGVATPPVGIGFWARKISQTQVQLLGTAVKSPVYEIPLKPGFNLIGNPFPFRVAWNAVNVRFGDEVLSLEDATKRKLLRNVIWRFQEGRYMLRALPEGELVPWEGHWVQSFNNITLLIPRQSSQSDGG